MSLCRFSSDDFQCDVYAYESVEGGYTVHVAGARYVFSEPLPDPVPFEVGRVKAFVDRALAVSQAVERAARERITLPHAGETFREATALACAERLRVLRRIGYRVPQYAIDAAMDNACGDACHGAPTQAGDATKDRPTTQDTPAD